MNTYHVFVVARMVPHAEYRVTAESSVAALKRCEAAYRASHDVGGEEVIAHVIANPGPRSENS